MYEKRAKEYRDVSAENKYLHKKKENIAQKIHKENAIRDAKSKESIGMNKITPSRPAEKMDAFINKRQKTLEKQNPHQMTPETVSSY